MTDVRIAINIALVPSEQECDEIVCWNRELRFNGNDQIELGTTSRIPHITLAMAVVPRSSLDELKAQLVSCEIPSLVEPVNMRRIARESGDLHHLVMEYSNQLAALRTCVQIVVPRQTHLANATHFKEPVNQNTIDYVQKMQRSPNQDFEPHITLGYGVFARPLVLPPFSVRLGVFALGNHCTCLEELS